jgi:hypothetical protein
MEWMVLGTGFCLSFFGSLPPGAINLSILLKASRENIYSGLQWALVAAFVELVFLVFAWQLTNSLVWVGYASLWSRPIAVLLLGLLSYKSFRGRAKTHTSKPISFRIFLGLNLFNLAAFPFWVGMLQVWPPVPGAWPEFFSGATLGAFSGYGMFAFLGRIWAGKSPQNARISSFLAWVFAGLAIWQLVLWLFNPGQ